MRQYEKDRIILLRRTGISYSKIAEALKIAENTVKSFCRRHKDEVTNTVKIENRAGYCRNCGKPIVQPQEQRHYVSVQRTAVSPGGTAIMSVSGTGEYLIRPALTAGGLSAVMVTKTVNIAAETATLLKDSELMRINNIGFKNQAVYHVTLNLLRLLREKGLISREEYRQINTILRAKYCPVYALICA